MKQNYLFPLSRITKYIEKRGCQIFFKAIDKIF